MSGVGGGGGKKQITSVHPLASCCINYVTGPNYCSISVSVPGPNHVSAYNYNRNLNFNYEPDPNSDTNLNIGSNPMSLTLTLALEFRSKHEIPGTCIHSYNDQLDLQLSLNRAEGPCFILRLCSLRKLLKEQEEEEGQPIKGKTV